MALTRPGSGCVRLFGDQFVDPDLPKGRGSSRAAIDDAGSWGGGAQGSVPGSLSAVAPSFESPAQIERFGVRLVGTEVKEG